MAIDKLRNNRAAGPDNIQTAFIRFDKPTLLNAQRKVIRKVCRTEKIPEVREEGIICPVHKKGDLIECRNCRVNTLLNTPYEVFSNTL